MASQRKTRAASLRQRPWAARRGSLALAAAVAAMTLAKLAAAADSDSAPTADDAAPPAVVIQLDQSHRPVVALLPADESPLAAASRGLVIWSEHGRDQWHNAPASAAPRSSVSAPSVQVALESLGDAARGSQLPGAEASLMSAQLEPLIEPDVIRAVAFVTPASGAVLNPRITIRRRETTDGGKLPQATLLLSDGTIEAANPNRRRGKPSSRSRISPNRFPRTGKRGLPPGQYSLHVESGLEAVTFDVVDEAARRRVMKPLDELARLTEQTTDPLYVQVAVEHLLAQRDSRGRERPYLADALDLLEALGEGKLSPVLREQRQTVLWRLGVAQKPAAAASAEDSTGNPQIDAARREIVQGWWTRAQGKLAALSRSADRRTRGLAHLYQGVIRAESGLSEKTDSATDAGDADAESCFREALAELEGGSQADLYRVHNDFANFLLRQAQDELYNHAFQAAAGVEHPLLTALNTWREACAEYEAALQAATTADERVAVSVSLARLYASLADVVTTLEPAQGENSHDTLRTSAVATATTYARQAATSLSAPGADPRSAGVVEEVLAHLAFRAHDDAQCLAHAERARDAYQSAGSLVGLESAYRLLGMQYARTLGAASKGDATTTVREAALRNLLIAHWLSETLRERYPADRLGLSRAGFFSRRAYVVEQIMELLLAEGKDAEALEFAELAKARSLQDLLATQGIADASRTGATADLESLAAKWPKDVAALEYYLGRERAWVFVVRPGFSVKAYQLSAPDGRPLDSRELVADVRRFLDGMGFQAQKMRDRLGADEGFDHAWQDTLHKFYRELLPPGTLESLRDARTVIVVPHHILHYFPFAALVTEPDRKPRGKTEMVQPRFLVDEPFALCHAPSLVSWLLLEQRRNRPIAEAAAMGIVDYPGAPVLAGVTRDLENVRAVFGPDTVIYSGDDAKLGNARAMFQRPGLLLFATHGENIGDHPLESRLLLYSDQGDASQLTAADLYRTRINADLVVMNACYSGLADRSPLPGDDLFGLQRAFLHGGARTVVAGLWDVYDGTCPT